MGLFLVMILGAAAYVLGLAYCMAALVQRRWCRRWWFLTMAALLLPVTGVVYLGGAVAGGLDEAEACSLSGHPYDGDYAVAHRSDRFPLSHPCNADHDLVAAWINPTLVGLGLVIVELTVAAVVVGRNSAVSPAQPPGASPTARA